MELPEHGTFRRYVATAMINFFAFYSLWELSFSFYQMAITGLLYLGPSLGYWGLYRHIGLIEYGHSILIEI